MKIHIDLLFLFTPYETRKFCWVSFWLVVKKIVMFVGPMFSKSNVMWMVFFKSGIWDWNFTRKYKTRFLCWQIPSNRHDVLFLKLHGESFSCSFNIFLLWPLFILLKLGSEITNLDIITVEQFVKLMRFWEMFTQ